MRGGLLQKGTAIAAATRKRGKTCMRLSFPPAGFFGTPAVFCVRTAPDECPGGVAGSERKNRREAGGFLCQREMSSIATGRVTMDKMVPVA